MTMSAAAMDGVSANGLKWKYHIRGFRRHIDDMKVAFAEGDVSGMEFCLRGIGAKMRPYMTGPGATMSESETIEWFETESPAYEFENGIEDEFKDEFDHRLGEIYDFADYHRILLS